MVSAARRFNSTDTAYFLKKQKNSRKSSAQHLIGSARFEENFKLALRHPF